MGRYRIAYSRDTSGDWGEHGGPLEATILQGQKTVKSIGWPFARIRAIVWWVVHGGWA